MSLEKFIAAYGDAALDNAETALQDMGLAIAAYETEDPDTTPHVVFKADYQWFDLNSDFNRFDLGLGLNF